MPLLPPARYYKHSDGGASTVELVQSSKESTSPNLYRQYMSSLYLTSLPHSELIAGGIAGSVSKTFTAPLSRLTILFQLHSLMLPPSSLPAAPPLPRPPCSSLAVEAYKILQQEGFMAFWKGNAVTLAHRLPYSAISFYSYDRYKKGLQTMAPWMADGNVPLMRLLAGGAAGITAAMSTYPLDLVRTRIAAQRTDKYYKGIVHAISTIAREEGGRGLYKGLGATLLTVGPMIAINFSVYETLKSGEATGEQADGRRPNLWSSLAYGSVAGIASSTLIFPLDLVRRRMQVMNQGCSSPSSHIAHGIKMGVLRSLVHIKKTEGLRGLYRGIIPEYLKVIPGIGITFMAYEFVKSCLTTSS